MFPISLIPIKDEPYLHCLARTADLLGIETTGTFVEFLFPGYSGWSLGSLAFPSRVSLIASFGFQKDSKIYLDEILQGQTAFPLFQPFLSEQQANKIKDYIATANNRSSVSFDSKFRDSHLNHISYCPNCSENDSAPTLNRILLIPFVYFCPSCRSSLKYCQEPVQVYRSRLKPLGKLTPLKKQPLHLQMATSGKSEKFLIQLADDAEWLMANGSNSGTLNSTIIRFRLLLEQKGFFAGSQLNHSKLIKELAQNAKALFEIDHPFRDTFTEKRISYVISSLHKNRGVINPFEFLAYCYFLDVKATQLFTDQTFNNVIGIGPWPCFNPVCPDFQKPIIDSFKHLNQSPEFQQAIEFCCDKCHFIYGVYLGKIQTESNQFDFDYVACFGKQFLAELSRQFTVENYPLKKISSNLKFPDLILAYELYKLQLLDIQNVGFTPSFEIKPIEYTRLDLYQNKEVLNEIDERFSKEIALVQVLINKINDYPVNMSKDALLALADSLAHGRSSISRKVLFKNHRKYLPKTRSVLGRNKIESFLRANDHLKHTASISKVKTWSEITSEQIDEISKLVQTVSSIKSQLESDPTKLAFANQVDNHIAVIASKLALQMQSEMFPFVQTTPIKILKRLGISRIREHAYSYHNLKTTLKQLNETVEEYWIRRIDMTSQYFKNQTKKPTYREFIKVCGKPSLANQVLNKQLLTLLKKAWNQL